MSQRDLFLESVKNGNGRWGLCDACALRFGHICGFRRKKIAPGVYEGASVTWTQQCPAFWYIGEW